MDKEIIKQIKETKSGQLFIYIPKDSGYKAGQYVKINEV